MEIPALDGLMSMKAKAMGDRAAQLRYAQDPTERTALMPDALEPIDEVRPAFFRRKAGKDLVDLTMLDNLGAQIDKAADIAETFGVRRSIATGRTQVQDDLVEEAKGLLARHRLNSDPGATLEAIRKTFGAE